MDRIKACISALIIVLLLNGCSSIPAAGSGESSGAQTYVTENSDNSSTDEQSASLQALSDTGVSDYTGYPYEELDDGMPDFSVEEKQQTNAFEYYSELDELGRCGIAYANICKELQPTEERGSIGQVKPSGWHTVKYSDIIEDNYLYNRCHLIAYQLAGENANEKNLITGTRYMNVEGMLPFENMIDDYVERTGNHVLYRVTPLFEGDNLVASGVEMEAWSVEDAGTGICFHVYCYNVQPGIVIDYATGDSYRADESDVDSKENDTSVDISTETDNTAISQEEKEYVLNTNTKKFHLPSCPSVNDISDDNKMEYTGKADDLIRQGYLPCKRCLDTQE